MVGGCAGELGGLLHACVICEGLRGGTSLGGEAAWRRAAGQGEGVAARHDYMSHMR